MGTQDWPLPEEGVIRNSKTGQIEGGVHFLMAQRRSNRYDVMVKHLPWSLGWLSVWHREKNCKSLETAGAHFEKARDSYGNAVYIFDCKTQTVIASNDPAFRTMRKNTPQALELSTRRARRLANRYRRTVTIYEVKPTPRTLGWRNALDALLGLLTGRPKPTSGFLIRLSKEAQPDWHDGIVAVIQPERQHG